MQTPRVQVCFPPHFVPSGAFGFVHTPVTGLQVPRKWHLSGAAQVVAVPVQVPPTHLSSVVQTLPSLHGVPLGASAFVHMPVFALQVPATWHWSGGGQTLGAPPTQAPATHLSPVVQELPSSQPVPSGAIVSAHMPVAGLQVPATWH